LTFTRSPPRQTPLEPGFFSLTGPPFFQLFIFDPLSVLVLPFLYHSPPILFELADFSPHSYRTHWSSATSLCAPSYVSFASPFPSLFIGSGGFFRCFFRSVKSDSCSSYARWGPRRYLPPHRSCFLFGEPAPTGSVVSSFFFHFLWTHLFSSCPLPSLLLSVLLTPRNL